MTITLTLAGVGKFALIFAAIVLLVILCIVGIKLITTLKKVNVILDDVTVVSGTVAEKTGEVGDMVGDAQQLVSGVISTMKGNDKPIKAAVNVVNSVTSLKGMMKKSDSKEDKDEE